MKRLKKQILLQNIVKSNMAQRHQQKFFFCNNVFSGIAIGSFYLDFLKRHCRIFRPAFGCRAHQMLVEICSFNICCALILSYISEYPFFESRLSFMVLSSLLHRIIMIIFLMSSTSLFVRCIISFNAGSGKML